MTTDSRGKREKIGFRRCYWRKVILAVHERFSKRTVEVLFELVKVKIESGGFFRKPFRKRTENRNRHQSFMRPTPGVKPGVIAVRNAVLKIQIPKRRRLEIFPVT